MVQVLTVPERTVTQRLQALERANEIRCYRAQLKRDLAAGRRRLVDVLDDPMCDSMRVFEVLLAIPKVGRVKANKVFARARMSPSKTCAGMTARQRRELLMVLNAYPSARRCTMLTTA